MENIKLTAEPRNKEEVPKKLRVLKMLPGIVSGKNQEPISLKLNYSEFLKTFRVSGESQIISLQVGKKDIEVLVHSVQKEPVSGEFIHVDFFALTRGQVLTTKIHLEFIGESEASKEGAIIEEHMKEIEVKCLPRYLRDNFEVDLSVLKEIGDSIKVSELNIDLEQYEILAPEDGIVVSANIPKEIKIEEEVPETVEAPEGEEAEEKKSEEGK